MTLSKLLERAGPRVRVQAEPLALSGSPEAIRLRAETAREFRSISVFKLLVAHGVGVRKAKAAADALLAGQSVDLVAPAVADFSIFSAALADCGLAVERHAPPPADVAAIRARHKLTQEEFAARFALGLATVQNWEQGRSVPDGPARSFLAVIDRYPEIAEEVVKARP